MADKLIFPVGFDLESGVRDVNPDKALQELQARLGRKPISIKAELDTSKFSTFERAFKSGVSNIGLSADALKQKYEDLDHSTTSSVNDIIDALKRLKKEWSAMPMSEKFDSDGGLTNSAQGLLQKLNELTAARRTYAQTADEVIKAEIKAIDDEIKAEQRLAIEESKRYESYWQQKEKEVAKTEQAEQEKFNKTKNIIARQNAESARSDEQRYQSYWKAVQKQIDAENEAYKATERATNKAAAAQRQASAKASQAAYEVNKALKAQETTIENISKKISIYQSQIKGMEIGSTSFNQTAAEIRRLEEELQKASQYLTDFQSKSFSGLTTTFTSQRTQELQQLRAQISQIDAEYNKLYQNDLVHGGSSTHEQRKNDLINQRIALTKQINTIISTAEDAQARKEKEINEIIEKRKAKQEAIAAKRREEQNQIRANIARLKDERRILVQQESSISAISAKLQIVQQRLRNAKFNSSDFTKAAAEVERLSKKLRQAELEINKLTNASATGYSKSASATRVFNGELANQSSYLSRLIQRMAVYASFAQMGSFLTQVREVTAQFELQRISLGAIIQDQAKADSIFGQIKTFALKSPVKILDLTKYTKQLAAYRIETDKLFDTTKRLADVSVGLGTDMDRLILAYGETRASDVMNAKELRQFAMMGIPMLELLSEKLSELNKRAITTSETFQMIKKRQVHFSVVEQVFEDLTEKGGMFYNMQEKQGNTLYGMWAKLGDAASIMYDSIGNTSIVNQGMKKAIEWITSMMRNWQSMARQLAGMATLFAGFKVGSAIIKLMSINTIASAKASREAAKAALTYNNAVASGNVVMQRYAQRQMKIAVLNKLAATTTKLTTAAIAKLRIAMMTFGPGALLVVLGLVIEKLVSAYQNAHKLSKALEEIAQKGAAESMQSVDNFISLANLALKAPDGSVKQKDALDELARTYKDMIPVQDLTIEKLRALNGNFTSLTNAIKQYVAQRTAQQKIDEITSQKGVEITKLEQKIARDYRALKVDDQDPLIKDKYIAASAEMVQKYLEGIREYATTTDLSIADIHNKTMSEYIGISSKVCENVSSDITKLVSLYREQQKAIDDVTNSMINQFTEYGKYSDIIKNGEKARDTTTLQYSNGTAVERTSFLGKQMSYNAQVKAWIKGLQDAGVQLKQEWYNVIEKVDLNKPLVVSSIDFRPLIESVNDPLLKHALEKMRSSYEEMAPSDPVVQNLRSKLMDISTALKLSTDKMSGYLWDGKSDIQDHLKTLQESASALEIEVYKYSKYISIFGEAGKIALKLMGVDVDAMSSQLDALNKYIASVQEYVKPEEKKSKKSKSSSDQRPQILSEILTTIKNINKEYNDLLDKEGKTQALADIDKIYSKTFENLKKLSEKYKFGIDFSKGMPTSAKALKSYMKQIKKAMKALPKTDKNVLSLNEEIEKLDVDEMQKKLTAKIKELADRISKTKTAKEFYNKILEQTGDIEIAKRISLSIYGDTGEGLFDATIKQLQELFKSGDAKVKINLAPAIDEKNQRIDYNALKDIYDKYKDYLIKESGDTAAKLIEDGQKEAAADILSWEKELAKAKDFEQQRTDIINKETQRRIDIYKSALSEEDKARLTKLSKDTQSQQLADLDVKEFRESDDFVKMFDNLENVTTKALQRMQRRIKEVIALDKDMDPTNMKAMVQSLSKIDEQLKDKQIWSYPVRGVKEYIEALKKARKAKEDFETIKMESQPKLEQADAEEKEGNQELQTATEQLTKAKERLAEIQRQIAQLSGQSLINDELQASLADQESEAKSDIVSAQREQTNAETKITKAQEKRRKINNEIADAEKKQTDAQDEQKTIQNKFVKTAQKTKESLDKVKESIEAMKPLLGDVLEDGTALGDSFNSMVDALSTFITLIETATTLQEIFNITAAANPWIAAIAGALAFANMIASIIRSSKTRSAEKIIEAQQDLLDNLEHSLDRLETAADKLLGADWLSNYNKQLANLYAQQAAYEKQLEAERSKGKDADDDKIDDYLDKIQEVKDQIIDMEGSISEEMLGQDLTSAAKSFAEAWIDAYKEFSNTTDAMADEFKDMIENMVANSVIAKVMEQALKPTFDMIDNMNESDFYDTSFWSKLTEMAEQGATNASVGAETMMKYLEQAGINLRETSSDITGISKDIASASEESINGLAQGINTQNYYISQICNYTRIIAEKKEVDSNSSYIDLITIQNQHLSNLPLIAANTTAILAECKQSAAVVKTIASNFKRIITTKGATEGVNIFMK